jgi:hypothetical protein
VLELVHPAHHRVDRVCGGAGKCVRILVCRAVVDHGYKDRCRFVLDSGQQK